MITTKPGTSEEVIQGIKRAGNIKGVIHADSVYGRFDVIVMLEAQDLTDVSSTVYEVVEKIPNVVRTETFVCLFSGK